MYAQTAFFSQIANDAAGNRTVLALIERGERFNRDGRDITAQVEADARRRLADAEAILAKA
jgi:hypothetical protein